MSTFSIEKAPNLESAGSKKGSAKSSAPRRRKVTSAPANVKKPPRSVVSKSERAAAAKTPVKAEEPKVERVTKQERMLTLLSQPDGASMAYPRISAFGIADISPNEDVGGQMVQSAMTVIKGGIAGIVGKVNGPCLVLENPR